MASQNVEELLRNARVAYLKAVAKCLDDASSPEVAANYASCVRNAKLALELDGSSAQAWNLLGQGLDSLGQTDQALAAFERAVELDPSDVDPLRWLGNAYCDAGQQERGLELLRRACEGDKSTISGGLYLDQLIAASRFDDARAALPMLRTRLGPQSLAKQEAALLVQETLEQHWIPAPAGDGEEEGRYLPTTHAAITRMEGALEAVDRLNVDDEETQEKITETRQFIVAAKKRRYDGGIAIPVATGLLGLVFLWSNGSNTNLGSFSLRAGIVYLIALPVYLVGARTQTYRWNARRLKGAKGAGDFLRGATEEDHGVGARIGSFVFAFGLLGLVAPVVAVYHLVRNYLFK